MNDHHNAAHNCHGGELNSSSPLTASSSVFLERIQTGMAGLDDVLNGGLPKGHLYLIDGDPETGKTTIALQFLPEGIRNGENVIYVTLSESRLELEQVVRSHGWSAEGLGIYEMAPPQEDLSPDAQYTVFHPSEVELADTITSVLDQVDLVKPQRVVFDSLSELRMLARDPLRSNARFSPHPQPFSPPPVNSARSSPT